MFSLLGVYSIEPVLWFLDRSKNFDMDFTTHGEQAFVLSLLKDLHSR